MRETLTQRRERKREGECVYEEEAVAPLMDAIASVSRHESCGSEVWACHWRRGLEAERVFTSLCPRYLHVLHTWDAQDHLGFAADVHASFFHARTLPPSHKAKK